MVSRNFIGFILVIMGWSSRSFAQSLKPPIGPEACKNWTSVASPVISDNGKYVTYNVQDDPLTGSATVIQSTNKDWKRQIGICYDIFFSGDNKAVLFLQADTLLKLDLSTNILTVIRRHVKLFKKTNDRNWMAYQVDGDNKELVLLNIRENKEQGYKNVKDFKFNEQSNVLLIESEENKGVNDSHALIWVSIPNLKKSIIWSEPSGMKPTVLGEFAFDDSGKKMAFLNKTSDSLISASIWSYVEKDKSARIWASNATPGIPAGFSIADGQIMSFNSSGDRLFIKLKKEISVPVKNEEMAAVNIWNYKDKKVYTDQEDDQKSLFRAVLKRNNSQVVVLEKEEDTWLKFSPSKGLPIGKYIISRQFKFEHEYYWQKDSVNEINLISTEDGKRIVIGGQSNMNYYGVTNLSPDEKFVVWYNLHEHQYYSYEISSGVTRNISSKIHVPLYDEEQIQPDRKGVFICHNWVNGPIMYLMLYDRYDIWMVDIKGQREPINLTGSYGRRNHMEMAMTDNKVIYSIGEKVVVSVFNRTTKENGLVEFKIGSLFDTAMLTMGPYIYCIPRANIPFGFPGAAPIAAKYGTGYVLTRGTAEESPNYYYSKDLRTFKKLSDVHPEKAFNWLTSELVNWTTPSGKTLQGILYKPENFNANKKYPIIFYYYEDCSDATHAYLPPDNWTSIPHMVNKDYLVFVPDIQYELGHPGNSAVNSVVSAAKYLSRFLWIDSTKMGITGASFGGYETNYLVTHSNIFAAAVAGAAPSDMVSGFGDFFGEWPAQSMYEVGQLRIGFTLWDRPNLYIENSPVFEVHNATTPLLLWHGSKDDRVRLQQAHEMYLNMRRAGKKVWLLQYNGEGHGISEKKNEVDLGLRIDQFFDYYLKGTPAPVWMTEGVPARFYQVKSGLETDVSNQKP